jgi:NTP pyrophosphatase (non-canonical NTP hydrolase)
VEQVLARGHGGKDAEAEIPMGSKMTSAILKMRNTCLEHLPKQIRQRFVDMENNEIMLALALCGEVGELANLIKKKHRDSDLLTEEIKYELADIRIYLELLARLYGIAGSGLDAQVQLKFDAIVERYTS